MGDKSMICLEALDIAVPAGFVIPCRFLLLQHFLWQLGKEAEWRRKPRLGGGEGGTETLEWASLPQGMLAAGALGEMSLPHSSVGSTSRPPSLPLAQWGGLLLCTFLLLSLHFFVCSGPYIPLPLILDCELPETENGFICIVPELVTQHGINSVSVGSLNLFVLCIFFFFRLLLVLLADGWGNWWFMDAVTWRLAISTLVSFYSINLPLPGRCGPERSYDLELQFY